MKARGLQKFQFANSLVNLEKFGSAAQAIEKSQLSISFMKWEKLGSIHSSPTFQSLNFESMDELGKLCPNLSVTVESKMVNLHKTGMATFQT